MSSLLYDEPGPRTRRITLITSLVATTLIAAGGYLFVYQPLAAHGQFTEKKWWPILDPTDPTFALLWNRLGIGIRNTLLAAVFAILASLFVGMWLAVTRTWLAAIRERRYAGYPTAVALTLRGLTWLLNVVTRVSVEVFRGLPVVITIFFVARGLPAFGFDLSQSPLPIVGDADWPVLGNPGLWYLVIGLTIYNGVVIGEILRSGMAGLPSGQREAAAAIGLSPAQATWRILLPQAFRIMLPALISQLVVVLKDTSLGFIISFEEVLRVASQAVQVLDNPIPLYVTVGVAFIVVNYSLSRLARFTQHRLSRGRRPDAAPTPPAPDPFSPTLTTR